MLCVIDYDKVHTFVPSFERMKYLIITGIFALGVSLGYVVGTQSAVDTTSSSMIADQNSDSSDEILTVHNHADNEPVADSELDSIDFVSDSIDYMLNDDTTDLALNDSSNFNNEEDLSISREKMIKTVKLPITYLDEEAPKDTSMQEVLGIDEVQIKSIYIEFWESPLNFEGYKLSKKKIIVYGLSPLFDYKMYKNKGYYYFAYHDVYFKMKETQDFLPFAEVSKSEVFND